MSCRTCDEDWQSARVADHVAARERHGGVNDSERQRDETHLPDTGTARDERLKGQLTHRPRTRCVCVCMCVRMCVRACVYVWFYVVTDVTFYSCNKSHIIINV